MRGKTIMSDNCDVANCADTSATMAEKGEIMKRGRTHCVAEALNDVSYKNNTHRPGISIYFFLKDEAVWPKYTRFDRRHRGDFTHSKSSARWGFGPVGLRPVRFEDGCYERIPLIKSGEGGR